MVELGIIAAMEIEAEPLIAKMCDVTTETVSGVQFAKGVLKGHTAVVAVCGVGKVFAALCAQTMILKYAPRRVINTGVAGSLTKNLAIGDLAVADKVVQHDMNTTALGDPHGLLSGINEIYLPADADTVQRLRSAAKAIGVHTLCGTIASGDRFVSDGAYKAWIVEQFDAVACEMEGAAIGQVCHVNRVPFAVVRAISDDASGEAQMDYPQFAAMAAKNSVALVCRMAEEL